jgi:crotonobetainyl-CoA:carnitine CoA-transferase CaiB-like acyl-CoA transferase
MANREALVALMNTILRQHTRAHWQSAFDAAGVPAGPVHTIGEALTHPQTLARGMVVELEHPKAGKTQAIGCPIHFSQTPARVVRPAPLLGQHTRELLREFDFSTSEIEALLAQGVVGEPEPATL